MSGDDPLAPAVPETLVAPGDSLGEALATVVRVQLERLALHLDGARLGAEPEAVHQMRVATRRLRAAVRFFGPALPARTRRRLEIDLHWLGRQLAPVRDLDVQLERYAATEPDPDDDRDRGADEQVLEALRRWLLEKRETERLAMIAALDSPRFVRLTIRLVRLSTGEERLLERARRMSTAHAGVEAVAAAHRRVLKNGRRIRREPRASELHPLRIRAKRLRYALEIVSDLSGRDGRRLVNDLADLQELLGDHQDARVGAELLRRFIEAAPAAEASSRAGAVATWLAREYLRESKGSSRFAKAWKRFAGKKTTQHVEDLLARLGSLADAFEANRPADPHRVVDVEA